MTAQTFRRIGRSALLISPFVIALAVFFAVLYGLRPRSPTFVLVLSGVFTVFVMGYANFLARRMGRRMDEVQIAGMGYASFHGWLGGVGATLLLLLLPPVSNRLIDLTDVMTAGAPDITTRHRTAVLLGFYFGFTLLVLMTMLCNIVATTIWWRRMGGMREKA